MEEIRSIRRFVLPRNRMRDLGFTGRLIAANQPEPPLTSLGHLSPEEPGTEQPLALLFQTVSGKYVCFARIVGNAEYLFEIRVFQPDQLWQIQEFFIAQGIIGKQLLRNWGVNVIEEIE